MRSLPPYTSLWVWSGARVASFTPQESYHLARRWQSVATRRTYEDAVEHLNTLQTPYKVLKERRDAGIGVDKTVVEQMRACLAKIGITQDDLAKLNVVHVAGTKGKGSTCAYVDSILSVFSKSKTYRVPSKIGLFTSPHLIAVRERFRINSAPISEKLFAKYFFEVWDRLGDMEKPFYFGYLTLMSYHVFLREGVNAAIYEVGIGGEYDSTNVVDKPAVTGISSLGIDHTFMLGETIAKIAWHKAGIQKEGVPSFTVNQPPEAMAVVEQRAEEKKVSFLRIAQLDWRMSKQNIETKPDMPFQRSNASLAVALAEQVLMKLDPAKFPSDVSFWDEETFAMRKYGINNTVWQGRFETIRDKESDITWYLDGAHTKESIDLATRWFRAEDRAVKGDQVAARVLIFNQQGDREAIELLECLHMSLGVVGASDSTTLNFDHVIFCPTQLSHKNTRNKDFVNNAYDSVAIADLTLQKRFAEKWRQLEDAQSSRLAAKKKEEGQPFSAHVTTISVLPNVDSSLRFVRSMSEKAPKGKKRIQVFVTGSIHLIGTALVALERVDVI